MQAAANGYEYFMDLYGITFKIRKTKHWVKKMMAFRKRFTVADAADILKQGQIIIQNSSKLWFVEFKLLCLHYPVRINYDLD